MDYDTWKTTPPDEPEGLCYECQCELGPDDVGNTCQHCENPGMGNCVACGQFEWLDEDRGMCLRCAVRHGFEWWPNRIGKDGAVMDPEDEDERDGRLHLAFIEDACIASFRRCVKEKKDGVCPMCGDPLEHICFTWVCQGCGWQGDKCPTTNGSSNGQGRLLVNR